MNTKLLTLKIERASKLLEDNYIIIKGGGISVNGSTRLLLMMTYLLYSEIPKYKGMNKEKRDKFFELCKNVFPDKPNDIEIEDIYHEIVKLVISE